MSNATVVGLNITGPYDQPQQARRMIVSGAPHTLRNNMGAGIMAGSPVSYHATDPLKVVVGAVDGRLLAGILRDDTLDGEAGIVVFEGDVDGRIAENIAAGAQLLVPNDGVKVIGTTGGTEVIAIALQAVNGTTGDAETTTVSENAIRCRIRLLGQSRIPASGGGG